MASAPSVPSNSPSITHLASCPSRNPPTFSSDESKKQQQAATFFDDEHPDTIGGVGEELVRIYMIRAAPPIQPAAIEQQTIRGVLASVRIQAQFDILEEDGMIIAIDTAQTAPSG